MGSAAKSVAKSAAKSVAKSAAKSSKSIAKAASSQAVGKAIAKKAADVIADNGERWINRAAEGAIMGASMGIAARLAAGGRDRDRDDNYDNEYASQPYHDNNQLPPPPPVAPQPRSAAPACADDNGLDLSEFSPKMQTLLRAAFEDGQITDAERQVLFRQAERDGMDPDEFQILLDAKLFRFQKNAQREAMEQMMRMQQNAPSQQVAPPAPAVASAPEKAAIDRCPNCGALIESGSPVCKECGFAFNNVGANSSSERLSNLLMDLENRTRRMIASESSGYDENDLAREKASIISNFPIPTDRANLLEFIISLESRSQYGLMDSSNKKTVAKAFKAKREECLVKARLYFESDPQFQRIFQAEEAPKKKKKFGLF